jgi:hypothetical protein
MSPTAAPAAPPKQRQRQSTNRDQSVRDRRWVCFDLEKFFNQTEWRGAALTPAVAADELGIHRQSFYNYRKSGRLPYLVYQGLVALFAPSRAPELEKHLVIEKGEHARMSAQAGERAQLYHRIRPGARIKLAEGGYDIVPADDDVVGSIPQRAAATDRETPLPTHVSADLIPERDRPKSAKAESIEIPGLGTLIMEHRSDPATEMDLMVAITARLHSELTAAHTRYHEMVGKFTEQISDLKDKAARADNDHKIEVARLTKRLADSESMLEELTNPAHIGPVHVPASSTPAQITEVKDKLLSRVSEQHPALGEFIKQLPFEVAHPT